jgi:hypothetical protein
VRAVNPTERTHNESQTKTTRSPIQSPRGPGGAQVKVQGSKRVSPGNQESNRVSIHFKDGSASQAAPSLSRNSRSFPASAAFTVATACANLYSSPMASLSASHRLDTTVRVLNNQAIACFSGAPFGILPMDFRVTSNPLRCWFNRLRLGLNGFYCGSDGFSCWLNAIFHCLKRIDHGSIGWFCLRGGRWHA